MKKRQKTEKVVIMQQGGILDIVDCPKHIKIIIKDYDIDGTEDNLKNDEYGDYREMKM